MHEFDQEDLVDPATVIKEKCAETDCTKYKERLDECNNRVRVLKQILHYTKSEFIENVLGFFMTSFIT